MSRIVHPTSVNSTVLKRNSMYLATPQLAHFMKKPMLAPVQISSRVVRVQRTTSKSVEYASSLMMSAGSNEPSGSASTIRSPVVSRSAFWQDHP